MNNKTPESQRKASTKWDKAHREKRRYISYRGTTKTFIKKYATADDLSEFKSMILRRQNEMSAEYKYEVIMGDSYPYPDATFETTSKNKAIETAKKWAKENPGQNIIISFDRRSDGQHGYINPDGAGLHGASWGDKQ